MEQGESKEKEGGDVFQEDAFCFVSSDFDPLKALQVADLQPPDITAEPLSNLEACVQILPKVSSTLLLEPIVDEGIGPTENKTVEDSKSKGQKLESTAGSLDFFSPDFDALRALHTKDLAPPNPRVRPLDNLSACRRILPEEVSESIVHVPAKVPRSAESILAQERAKAHKFTILQKAAERQRQVKILDKIAEKLKHGPVGLLAECYEQKLRVKVWTRHTRGVRGVLTGYLLAFDKHLNMVLRNIDEEYSVRRWSPRLVCRRGKSNRESEKVGSDIRDPQQGLQSIAIEKGKHPSLDATQVDDLANRMKEWHLFPKLEHRRRHLNQVLLRGDSVVMVQKVM